MLKQSKKRNWKYIYTVRTDNLPNEILNSDGTHAERMLHKFPTEYERVFNIPKQEVKVKTDEQ